MCVCVRAHRICPANLNNEDKTREIALWALRSNSSQGIGVLFKKRSWQVEVWLGKAMRGTKFLEPEKDAIVWGQGRWPRWCWYCEGREPSPSLVNYYSNVGLLLRATFLTWMWWCAFEPSLVGGRMRGSARPGAAPLSYLRPSSLLLMERSWPHESFSGGSSSSKATARRLYLLSLPLKFFFFFWIRTDARRANYSRKKKPWLL